MIDSVENLAIVWASIGRLCSDLTAGQLGPADRVPGMDGQGPALATWWTTRHARWAGPRPGTSLARCPT